MSFKFKIFKQINFSSSFGLKRSYQSSHSPDSEALLVLLRHGESIWNLENRFTGWCDVPLTKQGIEEAIEAGAILALRNHKFDVAFSSELQRAFETCELALEKINENNANKCEVIRSWRLNERHYGSLQGRKKDDPHLQKIYGEDNMVEWRRSYAARPPEMEEDHPFFIPPPAPLTESLQDCLARTSDFYEESIKPRLLAGEKVLVVAHANTIRALVKTVDDISDEDIRDLRIPNSIPLVYRLHPETLEPLAESDEWGFQGEYLTSWERANTAVRAVERSKKRVLQALFRALDEKEEGFITSLQFQKWTASSAAGQIKSSKSQEDEKNSDSVESIHKRQTRTFHFFRKWGLFDVNRKITFDEFITLSSEFWDSRDHFRMMKVQKK